MENVVMGSIVETPALVAAPVEEADDALTVQEALAFIDAFEGGPETDAGARSSSSSGSGSSAAPTSPESAVSDRPAAEADKKRRNSQAVRRCQMRKKQEMLELREQVMALERQLKQLQRVRRLDAHRRPALDDMGAVELDAGAKSSWTRVAQRELLARQRSEVINRQLRAAVAKHHDLSASIQSIVGVGALNAHRLASLLEDPPAPPLYTSPKKVFCIDYVLADLEVAMKKLYIDTDSVLNPISVDLGTEGGETRAEVKQSPEHGEYVEISQALVVPLPKETIAAGMWDGMCTYNIQTEVYYIKVRSAGDTDAHKNYEMQLDDSARMTRYTLDGISYMKKFEEKDRWLFAYTSLITIPGLSGITFREKSWMQLSRSPDSPSTRTILRMCYHLYPETPALMKPPALDSPFEGELRHTRSFLMKAIAAKFRGESAKIQHILYSQAS